MSDNEAIVLTPGAETVVADTPTPEPLDPAEIWLSGSMLQLPRFWAGRCITCVNWTPARSGKHGTCSEMSKAASDDLVNIGRTDPVTAATFGCVLYGEIDADADVTRERTELAIKLGLLDAAPHDFEPDTSAMGAFSKHQLKEIVVRESAREKAKLLKAAEDRERAIIADERDAQTLERAATQTQPV